MTLTHQGRRLTLPQQLSPSERKAQSLTAAYVVFMIWPPPISGPSPRPSLTLLLLYSSSMFLQHGRHIRTSGPLRLLFPQSQILFAQTHGNYCLTPCAPILKGRLLSKAFPDHLRACSPSQNPQVPADFLPQHRSPSKIEYILLSYSVWCWSPL